MMRLSFLYPHLFRSIRISESAAHSAKGRCPNPVRDCGHYQNTAVFSTTPRARLAVFERHGKAIEPPPPLPDTATDPATSPPARKQNSPSETGASVGANQAAATDSHADGAEESEYVTPDSKFDTTPPRAGPGASKKSQPSPQQAAAEETMQSSGPMDAVLHMPPPRKTSHPHISTPTYVHHFDTYTLVKQLGQGGYTPDQAITVMKAVRVLLAQHLDYAQDGLVSKSDVDNETYLFRAACSELRTEVGNNRRVADEQTRHQRTLLQHEVDILTQKLSQDLMTLKDDVKGMFNDRKMAVREEQRRAESAIQQINFNISVTLNSDAKSEIEGLRWVLIRRSALGILFMAFLTLATIRYATFVAQQRKKETEKKAREAEEMRRSIGTVDNARAHEAAQILAAN